MRKRYVKKESKRWNRRKVLRDEREKQDEEMEREECNEEPARRK